MIEQQHLILNRNTRSPSHFVIAQNAAAWELAIILICVVLPLICTARVAVCERPKNQRRCDAADGSSRRLAIILICVVLPLICTARVAVCGRENKISHGVMEPAARHQSFA